MKTSEVAKKYTELCNSHQNHIALETLFSADVVSVEALTVPGGGLAEAKGLKAVAAKGKEWMTNHEIHSSKIEGPWPHGNRFIVRFSYDVTHKPSSRRFQMEEAALFTVENGKIVREEFFYSTEG